MGKHAKLKEKQKWSSKKLHLENARKLRGIYFIDPEDKEFKETIKNARKKLETSVAPAMPCEIMKKNCGSGASNKIKTKLACILEADESTRMRMGNSIPHHHEDHIAGKGENSLRHYNLVHKFIPMPQALKIPAAKAAVDKEWEKLAKISAWNLTKVRSKKRGDRWSKDEGRKSSFRLTDGHMSFEKCWIGGKAPKIQRSSCTPRRYCERRFRVLRSIHWTRIISISNDSSKSHGYHLQTARVRRTSSWCSVCQYSRKIGRCSKIEKIQNQNVQMFGYVFHRHKWPKSWGKWKIPWYRNFFGHPLAGLLWERQFEQALLELGWEKVPNWECMFVQRKPGLFLSDKCGWYQNGRKEAEKWLPCGRNWWKNVHLDEPTSFLDQEDVWILFVPCQQGCSCLSTWMTWKWKTRHNYCENQNQSPQPCAFFYLDLDVQNRGTKKMTQQCRLKDIRTDTHWRDDLKRSWKKKAGTFPNRECLLTHQNKRLSLRLCGRYKNGSGKITDTSGSKGTNTSVRSRKLAVHAAWMQAELEDCTGEQERIRISDLSKCYETVTWHGEIPRWHSCLVPRCGRQGAEMRGKLLRIGKQKQQAIRLSLHMMFGWSSIQNGRIRERWRFIKVSFHIVLRCLYIFSSHWQTWLLYGPWNAWRELPPKEHSLW